MLCWIKPSPKGKLIIFIPAGVQMPLFLLPLPPCQTFAYQIQLTLAQSERLCTCHSVKVKVSLAPKVGRWRLRSQGLTVEPSILRRLDRRCGIYVTGCLKTLALLGVMKLSKAIMASAPCDSGSCIDFPSQPGESSRHRLSLQTRQPVRVKHCASQETRKLYKHGKTRSVGWVSNNQMFTQLPLRKKKKTRAFGQTGSSLLLLTCSSENRKSTVFWSSGVTDYKSLAAQSMKLCHVMS